MTREKLVERLEGLKAGKARLEQDIEKLKADRACTDGAIQECSYWLAQLPEPQQ